MKKVLFILGAAALVLASCAKSETVVKETTPGEIGFRSIANGMTKAPAELDGNILKTGYGIYAVATQRNSENVIENPSYFEGNEKCFATDNDPVTSSSVWTCATPQYWPLGGVRMDFLAYAEPTAEHTDVVGKWAATWDYPTTDVASSLTFSTVNTYANQVDMLYAAANGQTTAANAIAADYVKLNFNHAQALLIFNVKIADSDPTDVFQIDEIGFYTDARVDAMREREVAYAADPSTPALAAATAEQVTLKTVGTFNVDNTKIDLVAKWSALASNASNYKIKDVEDDTDQDSRDQDLSPVNTAGVSHVYAFGDEVATTSYYQLGKSLLIPEQEKVKFTLTYQMNGKKCFYTVNEIRGQWKKGYKYIYNLDVDINEIKITESVAPFTAESETINLN